jgi:precorrin-6Y C5,15-methyltransferase (decarboxylating)
MTPPWLFVVGIGEEGWDGLAPTTQAVVQSAEILAGGVRNLDAVPDTGAERLIWTGLDDMVAALAARRGRRVCVLATGNPMWFGFGATLTRFFTAQEMMVLPHPGAFSLAAARLGWPLQEVACLSVHGRPLESLALHLAPGARWLILSRDGDSPVDVTALLHERGYGASLVTVFEHLGGTAERRVEQPSTRCADLNIIAVECALDPGARPLSRLAGLPDDAFSHDGQITKREIRAATLAVLAPLPGELLWDVGAGCGSIAIEWMRAGGRAVAIEKDPAHCALIGINAVQLGVPELRIENGSAPQGLERLTEAPDAVFIGGGVSVPGVLEQCWDALRPGARLVANAVTLEGEAALMAWHGAHGGEMRRLAITRLGHTGGFRSWKPLMPVTQYVGIKR